MLFQVVVRSPASYYMNRCYKHGSVWVGTIVWTVFHKLSWTLSRHFLTNSNKHQCQGFVLLSVRGSLLCWYWQRSCVCVCCGCRSAGLRHVSIILLLNAAIVKRSCVASWWEHTVFLICLWWPSSSLKYGTLFYCRWKKNIFFYCLSVCLSESPYLSISHNLLPSWFLCVIPPKSPGNDFTAVLDLLITIPL